MDYHEKFKNLIPRSRFSKDILRVIGGTGLGQLVSILFYPVLARLYTPEEFGVLAVFISTLSIISVIGCLRYEFAIPLPRSDSRAINVLVLAIASLFATNILVWLFFKITNESVLSFLGIGEIQDFKIFISFGLLFFGLFQAMNFWSVRIKNFKVLARAKFCHALGVVGAQLALYNFGVLGLIVGYITGYLTSAVYSMVYNGSALIKLTQTVTSKSLKFVAIRYRDFPLVSSFSGLINAMGLYIPAIILTANHSLEVAGFFAFTQRIVSAPMSLIGRSVSQVYYAEASKKVKNNLYNLFISLTKKLFLFAIVPVSILAFLSPYLFELVFGEVWRESGVYLSYLSPMILIQFVVNPISQTLYILEKQHLQLMWDLGRLFTVILIFLALGDQDPRAIMLWFGIGMTLAYVTQYLIILVQIRSIDNEK